MIGFSHQYYNKRVCMRGRGVGVDIITKSIILAGYQRPAQV